jgi:hypothetical protein
MEMEKLFERIVANLDADKEEIKSNQAKMDGDRKKDKEDLMKKLDTYQAMTDAVLLALQVMETSHKEIVTECKPEMEIKTMACQEIEAQPEEEEKEPTSVYRKPEVAHQQEVPIENAEVMPVKEPKKKRRRD